MHENSRYFGFVFMFVPVFVAFFLLYIPLHKSMWTDLFYDTFWIVTYAYMPSAMVNSKFYLHFQYWFLNFIDIQ